MLSSRCSTEEADGDEGERELVEPPLDDEVDGALFTTTRAKTSFVEDDPTDSVTDDGELDPVVDLSTAMSPVGEGDETHLDSDVGKVDEETTRPRQPTEHDLSQEIFTATSVEKDLS